MCYLVAKDRNAHGCFALKTTHGKHLVELKRELNREVGYKGVQLVTISRQQRMVSIQNLKISASKKPKQSRSCALASTGRRSLNARCQS